MRVIIMILIISSIGISQKKTNNYSLGSLGYATNQNANTTSQTSMSSCAGYSGGTIRISDFLFESMSSTQADLYFNSIGQEDYTELFFDNSGPNFLRIQNVNRNYTTAIFNFPGDYIITQNFNLFRVTSNSNNLRTNSLNMYFNDKFNVIDNSTAYFGSTQLIRN